MTQRLQKILSGRGICSRRKAEEYINDGRVCVNGSVAKLGDSADPELDEITLDGRPLPSASEYVYIMLNKPRGFVTTLSDEKGRKNAAQLVADCGTRVYPVGRLDMDSEGLLLFTNDGDFANLLMHPKHEVNKTYHVVVTDYSPENLEKLAQPVTLDGYTIRKPDVKLLKMLAERKALLSVTIHEGRNRQVRRMFAAVGHEVVSLKRVVFATIKLHDLPRGQWRRLTDVEVKKLKELK